MTEPLGPGDDGIPQHAAAEDSEPIEAHLDPRPEPVLDAARLGGFISAAVIAVLGIVAVVIAGNVLGNLDALANAISLAVVAVSALVSYLAPVWRARVARAKVTPLADPRDIQGRKLVPLSSRTA